MTTPTEMELRVAKALNPWIFGEFPNTSQSHQDYVRWKREAMIVEARKAIRAMREPTEAMVDAGMQEAAVDLASEYRAMIDAASPPQE